MSALKVSRLRNMKILLSIVIANYNYGRFLSDAIESILAQCDAPLKDPLGCTILPIRGCKEAVELIICDAESTDNSVDIIRKYERSISWWCSEKDGGQSAAFNKGFSHAHGEWLTWLNADDIYLKEALRTFSQLVNRHPEAQWITGNKVAFDSQTGKIVQVFWGPHYQPPLLKRRKAFSAVFGPTTFFRREVYVKMGPIDECLHYAMDSEYWARFTLSGIRQTRLNHFCWGFRYHDASKTAGLQTDSVTKLRTEETMYWRSKLAFSYRQSLFNPWYLTWCLWRVVDGSWIKRKILKLRFERRNIMQMRVPVRCGKPRVVIVNEKLMDYRVPICNLLAKKYDLTYVVSHPYNGKTIPDFKILQIEKPKKWGPFFLHHDNLLEICSLFDAVIVLGEIRRLSLMSMAFRRRTFPMAFWTIGVSTQKGFDACKKWDWMRDFIYKKADACIFYSDYARNRAIRKGYDERATFVADNTAQILGRSMNVKKDSFLFMGTLYAQKGIFVLLDAYKKALHQNPDLPRLNIVGGGIEYEHIKRWVEENRLQGHIVLAGSVFDPEEKRKYFQRAHVCISPRQAGLSVLEAMGYGVPFVTMCTAITGGERLNIMHGENGILMRREEELSEVLLDVAINPEKYKVMGERACAYYLKNRTPEHMAQGLSEAIDYLLSLNDGKGSAR